MFANGISSAQRDGQGGGLEGRSLPPDIALAYRVNDAIKVSGLSRSSLYRLIGQGELHSVVVAGRRLIPADALRALLRGAA